jgi:NADH:ubiquinone oxidoreductase subunit 6 (subunit J)
MKRTELIFLLGLATLFLLMSLSFAYTAWESQDAVVDPLAVSRSLFDTYPMALILVGLLLGSSMIAGIYLAKEERP